MEAIVQRYVAQGDDTKDRVLGAAYVAVNKDGIISSGASGKVAFGSSTAFSTDTFARVASLTKLITITCVMQLVEQGKLNLDDDARETLPELQELKILKGFGADEKPILEDVNIAITLRMLLSHTVGLGYDNRDPELIRWAKAIDRKVTHLTFTKEGFTTPLKFAPGQGWCYGSAVDWAGIVLARKTGIALSEYMQEYIFDKLGMADTGLHPETLSHTANRTAPGSLRQPDGTLKEFPLPFPARIEVESGGAGLFTTAADYAKFLVGFLNGDLLKPETMDEMFRDQLTDIQRRSLQDQADGEEHMKFIPDLPKGTKVSSGLGGLISLENVPGKRGKGSMSWSGAFNSRWWIDREKGVAGVMVVNCLMWGDEVAGALFSELEKEVYAQLD